MRAAPFCKQMNMKKRRIRPEDGEYPPFRDIGYEVV